MSYSKKDPIKMNKGGKAAMYDMVKKYMSKGGKTYKAGGKRPDYPDADGDGNREEPLEQALKDAGKAYKGMKIKKAKGGMKVYNNGGKEDPKKLATPEEIKASRKGSQRGRTQAQKDARKESKREAKRQARRGAPGTGTGLVKTATTEATGPETLRTGQVRRRGRRLERSAAKAGLTKDQAYQVGKAEEALASATESGDKKKAKAANKTIKRQLKYQGQDKKRAVIPVSSKKKTEKPGDEKKKNKGRGRRILSAIKKAAQRPQSGSMPGSKKKKGVKRIDLNFPGGAYKPGGPRSRG